MAEPLEIIDSQPKPLRFLIWGQGGWISGKLALILQNYGKESHVTGVRMENREAVVRELARVKPTHVLNAACCTGKPNVDWCEDHKEETAGIHCTVFATGCLYQYDTVHPVGGVGFIEDDEPNFRGSFYSLTKGCLETVLKHYNNCLILRLRMPVSDDLHPRSFVTKIIAYEHIVNIPNSHSILHDLLPAAILLAEHEAKGVYNFTNPGAISHNQVLDLFKEIVRPGLTYKNFSEEEQAKILKAGRSNCELDSTKLVNKLCELGVTVTEIHAAYRECFTRMKAAGID